MKVTTKSEEQKQKLLAAKMKERAAKFEAKKKERIAKMLAKVEAMKNAEFKAKAPKVQTLTAKEFTKRLAEIEAKSEEFKKRKKLSIADVAEWTDAIEPTLMSIIATAKAAKEKVLETKSEAKDKRLFRRLIDKVEKTGLKAKDFMPAIKAQQNRIANLSEDLGDISKYLAK